MIFLFGGSFDPPHLGHVAVVEQVQKLFPNLEKLYILPNYISPLKKDSRFSKSEIRDMLSWNFEKLVSSKIQIDFREWENTSPSYTIDTLKSFLEENPNQKYALILGDDSISQLHLWKNISELLEILSMILVFKRNQEIPNLPHELSRFAEKFFYLDNSIYPVSSTDIMKDPIPLKNYLEHRTYEFLRMRTAC